MPDRAITPVPAADALALFADERETTVRSWADFSPCRTWRYALYRQWAPRPMVMFVGLNPSTADETHDDPTVRRCIDFARRWDDGRYGGLIMTNLFAYRATDPDVMKAANDPVGPGNDSALHELARRAGLVIAAWGVHGDHQGRADDVVHRGLLGRFHVLGFTQGWHPRHPLYMPKTSTPIPVEGPS